MDNCDVCGAQIDGANPPAESQYNGQTYCFCCDSCKQKFDANPQMYATQAA
jgi:P-type Cu+ transporter